MVVDGVNRFRREMPIALRHANAFTLRGVRYDLDRQRLANVDSVDDVKAAAVIQPLQSVWLKYAFGEERRPGGDVGIEAFFPNHDQVYLPVASGLATQGIRPNASGNYRASDMRMLGKAMAAGYQRNTEYGGRWGLFEIKVGARDPARLGVGVHARPPRALAMQSRERLKRKVRDGKAKAPFTTFQRRDGTPVTVPRVVDEDIPRLLFRTRPDATYRPTLTPSWETSLTKAAESMGDYFLSELADKMQRKAGLH